MIYRIYDSEAKKLLDKPETGMGYQIIEASQYKKYQLRKYVVYNTNLAVELNSDFTSNRERIINKSYSEALEASWFMHLDIDTIKILEGPSTKGFMAFESTKMYNEGTAGAKDNPKEEANGFDTFVRISAYEDDKRIDFENNRLKDGSYTTTNEDYENCVRNGNDPIDRYALPNNEKIKWSFYIKPKIGDIFQKGIVQPAFSHNGGGIEAYFEKGTSEKTYIEKREYGK